MTKKLKHRLVIEVTFDAKITETDAHRIIRGGLDTSRVNQYVSAFFVTRQPKVRKFELKRWSKIIPYVLKGEIT